MRYLLMIAGVITLLTGLLWWPAGVGEHGAMMMRVQQNHKRLVAEGLALDDPRANMILLAGFENSMARARAWEAGFLVLTGLLEVVAAWRMPRNRMRR